MDLTEQMIWLAIGLISAIIDRWHYQRAISGKLGYRARNFYEVTRYVPAWVVSVTTTILNVVFWPIGLPVILWAIRRDRKWHREELRAAESD